MTATNQWLAQLSEQDAADLERIITRFEDAWHQGQVPVIAACLTQEPIKRLALLIELIHADLYYRWRNGESIGVESYLERFPELSQDRAAVVGLIAAEFSFRQRQANVALEDHLQRFPEYRSEVKALVGQEPLDTVPGRTGPYQPANKPTGQWHAPFRSFLAEVPVLEGYEILGVLGRGGMGVVCKARQKALNRLVALKQILPELVGRPGFLERFRNEAQALARLEHPHIVRIYDQPIQKGQPFLVLEYCPGDNLADRLKRDGPWSPDRSAELVEILAEAVAFAHRQGFLHRDLKPANVLFDGHDRPRLSDFGLACCQEMAGQLTDAEAILGSPAYLAPEQADRQQGPLDEKTDVFGLGAILYQLLTGQPLYSEPTRERTLERAGRGMSNRSALCNPAVPAELEQICLKALSAQLAQRYAGAAALAADRAVGGSSDRPRAGGERWSPALRCSAW